jgi:hypothetical protein
MFKRLETRMRVLAAEIAAAKAQKINPEANKAFEEVGKLHGNKRPSDFKPVKIDKDIAAFIQRRKAWLNDPLGLDDPTRY